MTIPEKTEYRTSSAAGSFYQNLEIRLHLSI